MLQEVLLALSGHPSPLLDQQDVTTSKTQSYPHTLQSYLSPSESALLKSIGTLSTQHRRLRRHLLWIISNHTSTICRAVATSIDQVHLGRFQRRILDVERKILSKDASLVGAYDIVPLAAVVCEFDDWVRLMGWLWKLACYMQPVSISDDIPQADSTRSGSSVISHLRSEAHSGYIEIESAAIELGRVAETTWLRHLVSWLLYAKLPVRGSDDFFIHVKAQGAHTTFHKQASLLPAFVNAETATLIMSVGKSVHQIKQHHSTTSLSSWTLHSADEQKLASDHLRHIAALSTPIQSSELARAISAIRSSLSRNVLKHLLPIEMTMTLLSCLKQYFLLSRGEFALILIEEADKKLQQRQQSMGRLLQQDPMKALAGLTIQDAELDQVLGQTWKTLTRNDETLEDAATDFAIQRVSLSAQTTPIDRPSSSTSEQGYLPQSSAVAFNDLLFPTAASLTLTAESPLNLFVSPREIEVYSTINSYLLAIRRSQVHLSDLWRRTVARRDHPCPSRPGSITSRTHSHTHARNTRHAKETRKVWATCSAALFLISETAAYFEGEVIKRSSEHFEEWIQPTSHPSKQPADDTGAPKPNEPPSGLPGNTSPSTPRPHPPKHNPHHDPELLSHAHKSFLSALLHALLLTDTAYTKALRSLLSNIDLLIAHFIRLIDLQQQRSTQQDYNVNDDGQDDASSTQQNAEEVKIKLDLDRSRKKVDSDLRSVVGRLRALDEERIVSLSTSSAFPSGRFAAGDDLHDNSRESEDETMYADADDVFVPWKGTQGGVGRLLMKLEVGRGRNAVVL